MATQRHNIPLHDNETRVAQWETRGNDWLILYRYESERYGTVYSYRGNGCGGGIPIAKGMDDEAAIKEMERPWGGDGKPGAGQAFVLKLDRPSLRRVWVIAGIPLVLEGTVV